MSGVPHAFRSQSRGLLSIADRIDDDDEARLRKHVGVAAGMATIIAPLGLPIFSNSGGIGVALAIGLSISSIANLAILAWTKGFERYVYFLIGCGPAFVFIANVLSGGILSASAGFVWAFLVPAYALLALGPRRATPWFMVFVCATVLAVVLDPIIRLRFTPPSYTVQLAAYVQNVLLPLGITFVLLRYVDLRRRAAEARSDELLTNAIPRLIADRLRHGEDRIADGYPATTIVFADVAGFTPWASTTDPARVVELLDDLFSRFDAVATASGVEKIKTVGDAYMAVAGAPEARTDHAAIAIRFAEAQLREVESWRTAHDLPLQVRIGAASGPVVGGVIGRRRLLFDLWGATVNMASRMESSGIPGRIQVAASTRELLGGSVSFDERRVEVKGLGQLTTYLIAKPALEGGQGVA